MCLDNAYFEYWLFKSDLATLRTEYRETPAMVAGKKDGVCCSGLLYVKNKKMRHAFPQECSSAVSPNVSHSVN